MMGDPLGSSRVSSQKQNREGVVGAQNGQYSATVVERARVLVDPGSGCDINECIKIYYNELMYLNVCISMYIPKFMYRNML